MFHHLSLSLSGCGEPTEAGATHGGAVALAHTCARARLRHGKKALAKRWGDVGSLWCQAKAFLASPPDIEARPWRVLVFLGFRSPGLLDRASLRTESGRPSGHSAGAGTGRQRLSGCTRSQPYPWRAGQALPQARPRLRTDLDGAAAAHAVISPFQGHASEKTAQRRASFPPLRANQDFCGGCNMMTMPGCDRVLAGEGVLA